MYLVNEVLETSFAVEREHQRDERGVRVGSALHEFDVQHWVYVRVL